MILRRIFRFANLLMVDVTSLEVFDIINHFLEANEIYWENCTGVCTDGPQSMSGRSAGHLSLVTKKAPHVIWTHCVLHR
jgi:hypothetical protein